MDIETRDNQIIEELVTKAKAAQAIAADFDQTMADRAARAIAKVVYDNAETLAREAAEETGMSTYEQKLGKIKNATTFCWYFLKDKKSVGVVESDPEKLVDVIAKPAGVVACLTPSTNPVVTPMQNGANALKGRNAMIVAPHPGARQVSLHTINLMREALEKVGAPADLIQVIEEPSLPLSQKLMAACDLTIATGGPGMVRSAYSSGKPSFGVGQGNVNSFIGKDHKDIPTVAEMTFNSRMTDNGVPCTCDQTVHVSEEQFEELIENYKKLGAFYIDNEEDREKLRKTIFREDKQVNRACVGRPATLIAEMAGIEVPADTKCLVTRVDGVAEEDMLCREIMSVVLRVHPYKDFAQTVEDGRANYLMEGAGHSTAVFSDDEDEIALVAERIPVCRVAVNQVASSGAGRPFSNGMPHTLSLGCGFWGGNSISENLTYKHLMNYSRVHRVIPGLPQPTADEIWGEEC